MTATLSPAEKLILDAVNAAPVVDLADLRAAMPPRLRGLAFDRAVLALADARRVVLFRDVDVAALTAEQLRQYVRDGDAVYTTASPRR